MTVNGQVIITKEELDIPATFEMLDNDMEDDEEEDLSGLSSMIEVEEQFSIVKNESFMSSELARDHAYTTHDASIDDSFCNDMIQQIIQDSSTATKNSNPLSILAQYTVMLENVFDDGTNSQWSILLKKMKASLDLLNVDAESIALTGKESELIQKEPTEVSEPQDDIDVKKNQENTESITVQDLPETVNCVEKNITNETQQTEDLTFKNELVNEMEKISNFCKKLQTYTTLSIKELGSPDNVTKVREKFHLMLKESKEEFRLLLNEFKFIDVRQQRENGIQIKEKLLGQIDSSESSATDSDFSDDDTGQILNLNRELKAVSSPPAPSTPAIVSSTKESDSEMVDDGAAAIATTTTTFTTTTTDVATDVVAVDASKMSEQNRDVPKSGSDGDESSVDMEWDDEKQIEKLLDLSTLDNVRPQRSTQNKSKKDINSKKLKKKLEKIKSDNSFVSSSDNESESSESEVSWKEAVLIELNNILFYFRITSTMIRMKMWCD